MITTKKNYKLYAPRNSWDTNYHLLDDDKEIEYLIDIDDITHDEDDEDGGLFIKTLLELKDIDEILIYAWKLKPYTSRTHSNLHFGTFMND